MLVETLVIIMKRDEQKSIFQKLLHTLRHQNQNSLILLISLLLHYSCEIKYSYL